ncbi:MAG: hypothetical protein ACJA10_000201 [Oleispira sp.]|jgi:hypothetical protein
MINGQRVDKRSLENIPQVAIQQGATINWIYDGGSWNLNAFFI